MPAVPSPPFPIFMYIFLLVLNVMDVTLGESHSNSNIRGHLEHFGNHRDPEGEVASFEGFLPPDVFRDDYLLESKPIVFKNAASRWPAIERFTDDYFMYNDTVRNLPVVVEQTKKENKAVPWIFLRLKEFIKIYNVDDVYLGS